MQKKYDYALLSGGFDQIVMNGLQEKKVNHS